MKIFTYVFNKIKNIFRKIKKILQKREFWFSVIIYPLGGCAYLYLKRYINMSTFNQERVLMYSEIIFVIFAALTIFTAYELIEKRLLHKRQGDKLRLKTKQKDWKN